MTQWLRMTCFLSGTTCCFLLWGCTPDEKQRDVPPARVAPVEAYGLTLDENATPEQVAFVLLRSIADDVRAAQDHEEEQQKAALRTTHALIAHSTVERRLAEAERKSSLGAERDQKLYAFARQLAPIVAHYVRSFDTELSEAVKKMRLVGSPAAPIVHVYYEAAHDPDASDVKRRDPVLIDIELAREPADGKSYWRVTRVAFAGRPNGAGAGSAASATRESIPRQSTPPATAPTTAAGQ